MLIVFLFYEKGQMGYARDDIVVAVIFDYRPGSLYDITSIDGVDSLRSRTGREHRKYTGSATDVENDGIVEHGGCPEDEGRVRRGAHFIGEHRGMDF